MIPYEKRILDERLKDFMGEVIPVELLPYLPCLQKTDKEAIEAKQTNDGPTIANQVLVDRLKRRDKGFQQFVQALRKCGSEHTALLLDPYYNYPIDAGDDEVADTDGSGIGYKKIGTAIDVTIKGNLLLETSADEQQPESCFELEKYLADLFKKHSSAESKRMRRDLQEYLPQGAVFVNTAKGSIIATFRLSTVEAAKKLREMYDKGEFQATLQKVLVDDTLKEHEQFPDKPLKLNLSIGEDRFNQIQKKLAEIEEEQEIDVHLRGTLSSKQEGSAAEDDGSVPEIEIDIPPVFLGNDADSFGVCELELREYQKELAAPALEGKKNTIICAPTNSGKTYVAIEIAKKHLESFSGDADATGSSSRKEPRVVFIVSTVNLVLQQKERFEAYLGDKYSVGEISGANSTEIPLKYLLQNHKIIVMTAQILVNALNSKTREESVKLDDISLLLFDECHHAHKEHSYNRIMERYLALKSQAGRQHNLPQVVGFTASLGTGKAKSVEKAEEHILLVSANLDAEVISTVQKNQGELKQYANVPERKIFHITTSGHDPFEKIVSQVMDKIEAKVKEMKGKSFKCGPPDKASQQYRQWVEEFYKDSIADAHRHLITFTEHLREYHIALTINKSTTMKNAKKRLQSYFDSLDEEKFLPIDRKLKNLFHCAMKMLDKAVQEQGEPENPFLMELKKLLLQYMKPQQRREDEDQSRQMGTDNSKNACDQDEKRGDEDSDSHKSGVTAGNDNKTNEESQDKNGNGMILENEDSRNGEESDGSGNGNTVPMKRGLAARNADATEADVRKDEVENDKPGPAKDEASKQESQPSAEKMQDDKPSDDGRNGGQKEWKGPKGILFTRTRESTLALEDWIKETEELKAVLRPEALVGSGDGNIGMTQNEQERVIKRFHTGEKNLLLATSVAEEGLDIRDCNFVIRYDMMGNEISTVQSRGRVRADEGKYSVLVGRDSGALKREYTNQFRESLMIEALTKVQGMDLEVFKQMVKDIQRKNCQDRYLKKHVITTRKSVHLPDDVAFHCRKCDVMVCQAHDIRRIRESHHVIISSDALDKVHIKDHPYPKTIDDIVMNKKIHCKNCGEDWGVTALINGMEWLCIKISSFVLEFPKPNRRRQIFKKWKNLPFGIPEATLEEILQQAQNGAQDDFDDDLSP